MPSKTKISAAVRRPARGFDAAKGASANPFEDKWARRAANAASRAGSERRAAIVAELRAKGCANSFADRRIGEDDPLLSLEDRYLARLQQERSKRATKRARFNLSEADNGADGTIGAAFQETGRAAGWEPDASDDVLTHAGRVLNTTILRDDYVVQGLDSDEDDQDVAVNPASETGQEYAGRREAQPPDGIEVDDSGFSRVLESDDHRKRTHKEIMDEVIAKSKSHKAERQQEKAKTDEQTTLLDSQLPQILQLLNSSQSIHSIPYGSQTTSANDYLNSLFDKVSDVEAKRLESDKDQPHGSQRANNGTDEAFNYEKVYLQLATEKRAYATDRVKTEEEKDAEERDRLKELERLRRRRMTTMEVEETEDRKDDIKSTRLNGLRGGGDDLNDDFDISGESDSNADEARSEDESESDSGSSGMASTDGENAATDMGKSTRSELEAPQTPVACSKLQEDAEKTPCAQKWSPPRMIQTVRDDDIPFIFSSCPESFAQLQEIFKELTCSQRNVVISRLRKCFAISLNPARNRPKLLCLLSCLLLEIDCAAESAGNSSRSEELASTCDEINILLPHVFELAQIQSDVVITWARNHVQDAYAALTENEFAGGTNSHGLASRWSPETLFVLRAIARLFPGSDLRHVIVTPLVLLLSHSLSSVPILDLTDMSVACFAAAMLLELLTPAKRYSGELICFIGDAIGSCREGRTSMVALRKYGIPEGLLADADGIRTGALRIADCVPQPGAATMSLVDSRRWKQRILNALEALARGVLFDGGLKSIREATAPVVSALLASPVVGMSDLYEHIMALCGAEEKQRAPLMLYSQSKSSTAPRLLNPRLRMDGDFAAKRRGSAVTEMEAQSRLRRRVKKETRSAARELRRDGEVIAAERLRAASDNDARRAQNGAKIRAFMERQQHDAKRQTKAVPVGAEGLASAGRKRKKW